MSVVKVHSGNTEQLKSKVIAFVPSDRTWGTWEKTSVRSLSTFYFELISTWLRLPYTCILQDIYSLLFRTSLFR